MNLEIKRNYMYVQHIYKRKQKHYLRNLEEIKKPTVAILESYSGGEGREVNKEARVGIIRL